MGPFEAGPTPPAWLNKASWPVEPCSARPPPAMKETRTSASLTVVDEKPPPPTDDS